MGLAWGKKGKDGGISLGAEKKEVIGLGWREKEIGETSSGRERKKRNWIRRERQRKYWHGGKGHGKEGDIDLVWEGKENEGEISLWEERK